MEDQPLTHVGPDGSVYRVLADGRLEPVSVEEGQAVRDRLEEVKRDAALRRQRELEEQRRRDFYRRQATQTEE